MATGAALIFAGATTGSSLAAPFVAAPLVAGALGLAGLGIDIHVLNHNITRVTIVSGIGGSMIAESMCLGPVNCRSVSGQCCVFDVINGVAQCPPSC